MSTQEGNTRFSDTLVMLATIVLSTDRNTSSHVAGSSMVFITMANAALTAILLGSSLALLGWPTPAAILAGSACGLAFAAASSFYGYLQYRDMWKGFPPLSPTPPEED